MEKSYGSAKMEHRREVQRSWYLARLNIKESGLFSSNTREDGRLQSRKAILEREKVLDMATNMKNSNVGKCVIRTNPVQERKLNNVMTRLQKDQKRNRHRMDHNKNLYANEKYLALTSPVTKTNYHSRHAESPVGTGISDTDKVRAFLRSGGTDHEMSKSGFPVDIVKTAKGLRKRDSYYQLLSQSMPELDSYASHEVVVPYKEPLLKVCKDGTLAKYSFTVPPPPLDKIARASRAVCTLDDRFRNLHGELSAKHCPDNPQQLISSCRQTLLGRQKALIYQRKSEGPEYLTLNKGLQGSTRKSVGFNFA